MSLEETGSHTIREPLNKNNKAFQDDQGQAILSFTSSPAIVAEYIVMKPSAKQ
jgi:hypothetical protein